MEHQRKHGFLSNVHHINQQLNCLHLMLSIGVSILVSLMDPILMSLHMILC